MAVDSAKITFEVPRNLKVRMEKHPEVNWSAVFRESIRRQIRAAEIAQQILKEENDPRIQAVAALLKKRVGERFRRELKDARRR